jgi:hypothetical protein
LDVEEAIREEEKSNNRGFAILEDRLQSFASLGRCAIATPVVVATHVAITTLAALAPAALALGLDCAVAPCCSCS